MKWKACALGVTFLAGYSTSHFLSYTNTSPFTIEKHEGNFYVISDDFKKILSYDGELGTVYERMLGLLHEDSIDLEYSLKKIQRTSTASETSDID